METEMNTPESGLNEVPLNYIKDNPVLARYAYKVAYWLDACVGFTEDGEKYIQDAYIRGYHPRRTAQELMDLDKWKHKPLT